MPDQSLKSLNAFLDVVFAVVFVRIIEYLPSFEDKHWVQLPLGLLSLLASEPANLTRVAFGTIVIVYYWSRKNALLRFIERSSATFAVLSIASLFFVCLFMWALIADPTYAGGPPTLLLQSGSLLVAGLFGYAAFVYAIRAGLTRAGMMSSALRTARIDLSNPLTAAIATALAWSGLIIWTLSWFVLMPLFGTLLARRSDNA